MDHSPATLVCFAVKDEARFFLRKTADRPNDAAVRVRTLITGIGRRNAEQALRSELQAQKPGLILTCGFAGGLNPSLPTGAVLFAADGQPVLEKALLSAGAQPARFHCAGRVATTAREKRALWESTRADAVEMESMVLLDLCRRQAMPCAIVRVILDPATEDLPLDFNDLMTPDLRLSHRKLALALMRSPAKLGALLRLQKQTEFAAQKLAETLLRILPE